MANAFSICSLTQNWRYETHPGIGMVDIGDPEWLVSPSSWPPTETAVQQASLTMIGLSL